MQPQRTYRAELDLILVDLADRYEVLLLLTARLNECRRTWNDRDMASIAQSQYLLLVDSDTMKMRLAFPMAWFTRFDVGLISAPQHDALQPIFPEYATSQITCCLSSSVPKANPIPAYFVRHLSALFVLTGRSLHCDSLHHPERDLGFLQIMSRNLLNRNAHMSMVQGLVHGEYVHSRTAYVLEE